MATVVKFEGVSKQYFTGERKSSLREVISTLPKRLIHKVTTKEDSTDRFWALKEVSFDIEKGEVLGIIGPNGAGKTTALKLLSGVTKPTTGQIYIKGRISALIELGAGFHPELTGRENIYLNGVILGLSRAEINHKFDSIVSFSGLTKFIDTPVKRYSSGMYVRLGFAVAAHVDPDILLVDEVLAVGDHEFRVRCIDRFRQLNSNGVTTVLVSHQRQLIESLCTRAVFLNEGRIEFDGNPGEAWDHYLAAVSEDRFKSIDKDHEGSVNAGMSIKNVEILDGKGVPRSFFKAGESMRASIAFSVNEYTEDPVFYARFYRDGMLVHGTNSARFKIKGAYHPGDAGTAMVEYDALNLLEGTYEFCLGIEKSFYSLASYDRVEPIVITIGSYLKQGAGIAQLDHNWAVLNSHPTSDKNLLKR